MLHEEGCQRVPVYMKGGYDSVKGYVDALVRCDVEHNDKVPK